MADYPVTDAWGRQVIQKVQVDVDEESLLEIAQITNGRFCRPQQYNRKRRFGEVLRI